MLLVNVIVVLAHHLRIAMSQQLRDGRDRDTPLQRFRRPGVAKGVCDHARVQSQLFPRL
jgi:hypothetical protein